MVYYLCRVNNFSKNTIPFSSTNQFPKLFLDYASGAEKLFPFYSYPPNNTGYADAAKSFQYNESIRPILVEVIRKQYESTGITINENLISKLAQEGTFTICTGHQLCLFTGPMYFIYKIITTINIAEKQSKLLGKNIVPIYWMASEDHDFDEIRSVNIFGKTLAWDFFAKGAVGDFKTDSLAPIILELKTLLGESPVATKLFGTIEKAYREGRTLTQATREFVNELFNGEVLILDSNDARLKKYFVPQFIDELENQNSELQVNASISKLSKLGYDAQVKPRKLNFFFMKKNIRERIEEKDGKFVVLNSKITFSKSELIYEMENYPGNFSPNVVLRPLFQQIILPNIAYVGGPGEISYWLEYKEMFDHFKIAFPILQPRHFAMMLDKRTIDRMSKFEITLEELFGDVEELVKSFVKKNSGDATSLESEKEGLKKIFDAVRDKIVPVDPTLKGAVDAELQKQLNALENLEAKVMRAAKQKQETAITQIRKLREKLLPGGILQERYENFIPFYLKAGERFIAEIQTQFEFPVDGLLIINQN